MQLIVQKMNKPVCIIDPRHAAYSKVCCRINHKDSDIVVPTPESNLKLTPKEISLIEKINPNLSSYALVESKKSIFFPLFIMH